MSEHHLDIMYTLHFARHVHIISTGCLDMTSRHLNISNRHVDIICTRDIILTTSRCLDIAQTHLDIISKHHLDLNKREYVIIFLNIEFCQGKVGPQVRFRHLDSSSGHLHII